MTRLEFNGKLDAYGTDTGLCDVSPTIAGRHVIDEIDEAFGIKPYPLHHRPNVTVYLGVEPIKAGPMWTSYGFGGTDVTPPESPEIWVGDLELVERLRDLDKREVALVITDEEQ